MCSCTCMALDYVFPLAIVQTRVDVSPAWSTALRLVFLFHKVLICIPEFISVSVFVGVTKDEQQNNDRPSKEIMFWMSESDIKSQLFSAAHCDGFSLENTKLMWVITAVHLFGSEHKHFSVFIFFFQNFNFSSIQVWWLYCTAFIGTLW